MTERAKRLVGQSVRRSEDARLLTGRAQFVDDVQLPRMAHAAFLRSEHAHATLVRIDLDRARKHPGVIAVFAADDLGDYWKPGPLLVPPPPIKDLVFHARTQVPFARGKVRYVGEPIAVVVAESRYIAEDALADIDVTFEPLPATVDLEASARDDAPRVHDDLASNLAAHVKQSKGNYDKARAKAHTVIARRFTYDRGIAGAIENRAVVASWDALAEEMTIWDTTQAPIPIRNGLAAMLGLGQSQVRVIAPFVGGGFGPKIMMYYPEEVVIPWVARNVGRPVKWIEDRRENFTATTQERGQVHDAEIALDKHGKILGIKDVFLHDTGAYDPYGLTVPINSQCTLLGPYAVPHYQSEFRAIFTNKPIVTPVRGAGRQHGVFVMERLLDIAARELNIDRVEIRQRNFLRPKDFPHNHEIIFQDFQPLVYDSGNYAPAMQMAADMIGYEKFVKEEQPRLRAAGKHVGLGIVSYIEGTGIGPYEGARVTVEPSGRVRLATGVGTQGQGHFTSFAQIVADQLGVQTSDVSVVTGDTQTFAWGTGTFASRGAVVAGSACHEAALAVREKAIKLAARLLDVREGTLDIAGGRVFVRSDPTKGFTLGELAARANPLRGAVTAGTEPGLEATKYFGPQRGSTASGVHAMRVEVDPETMQVEIQRYVVVHDCGVQINPMIVEGQIQGGVASGIGNAFYEQLVFDDGGQLMNASLMDYLLPTALDVPTVEMAHIETPSPLNPTGAKGVGEAGAIPTGALFAQAVEDALRGTGLEIAEIPLSPGRLFTLVNDAKRTGPKLAAVRGGRALVVSGTYELPGAAADVYKLLLDPSVLASVMPGTQKLERHGDVYLGSLKVGIGPMSAVKFDLTVTLTEQSPPESYAMRVEAKGTLGFVNGMAHVKLAPGSAPNTTRMDYRAELQLGGTVAAVGQRMLDSVSKVMSAQGLKALDRVLREKSAAGASS
jgi:carbon-monoxide dehydrogenase large subunit